METTTEEAQVTTPKTFEDGLRAGELVARNATAEQIKNEMDDITAAMDSWLSGSQYLEGMLHSLAVALGSIRREEYDRAI